MDISEIKSKVTPAVFFVLKSWTDIIRDMKQFYPSVARNKSYDGFFSEKDKKLATTFYNKYKSNPKDRNYIVWHDDYFRYFDSVLLRTTETSFDSINFAFPFQCRQWPTEDLLKRVIQTIKSSPKAKINISEFLFIWLLERRYEVFSLSKKELLVLRYIVSTNTNQDNYNPLDMKKIATYLNLTEGAVSRIIKKLRYTNVFEGHYLCNLAKLGFSTILVRDNRNAYQDYRIATLKFDDKRTYNLLKIPLGNFKGEIVEFFDLFQYGYSLASLKTRGDIIEDNILPFSFFKDLDATKQIHSYNTFEQNLTPTFCYIEKTGISPEDKPNTISKHEFEILNHFSPPYFEVIGTVSDLAGKYGYSIPTVRGYLNSLIQKGFLYPFISLYFLGFPENCVMYAKGSKKSIEVLKNYLRSFFHYRFFFSKNRTLLAFIRLTKKQYKVVNQELHRHRAMFSFLNYSLLDPPHTFIQKTIDFKVSNYKIDPFLGLQHVPERK